MTQKYLGTIVGFPERSADAVSYTHLDVYKRQEVPCCGGLELAAKKALQASGKFIPWQIVTISLGGKIVRLWYFRSTDRECGR